jgi:Cu(I)/Ag(I) efflux system membrane fusion protein
MNRIAASAVLAAVLGIGLTAGYLWGRRGPHDHAAATAARTRTPDREVLYWYDPMKPDQRFDQPGKSPFMDMMLVPRYADQAVAGGIRIEPGMRQGLGIRTAVVEVASLDAALRVSGIVQWDLRGEYRVSARADGVVERLHVRAPFDRVRRGAALATLAAPELAGALAEYRALSSADSAQASSLRAAALSRLQVLGLTEADAHGAGGAPRIVLRAPGDGVVTEIGVREGEAVSAGQSLFRLNTSDRLWLDARLPQSAGAAVTAGTPAEIRIDGQSGAVLRGTVEALLPELEGATRTQVARIVLDNREGRLVAGQLAEVVLTPPAARRGPVVPNEALILTGREARVIVDDGGGRFRPVPVRTGRQSGDRTEILEGLAGGEHVVVSGQFLLDSEASVSGALSRLPAPSGEGTPP